MQAPLCLVLTLQAPMSQANCFCGFSVDVLDTSGSYNPSSHSSVGVLALGLMFGGGSLHRFPSLCGEASLMTIGIVQYLKGVNLLKLVRKTVLYPPSCLVSSPFSFPFTKDQGNATIFLNRLFVTFFWLWDHLEQWKRRLNLNDLVLFSNTDGGGSCILSVAFIG